MLVRLYVVEGPDAVFDQGGLTVSSDLVGTAKKEARKVLREQGWFVRSLAVAADGTGELVAYLEKYRKVPVQPKARKKPVTHEGPVGGGRRIVPAKKKRGGR